MSENNCATCGKPIRPESPDPQDLSPFCSERCRKIDLGRWLGERFRVSEPASISPEELEDL